METKKTKEQLFDELLENLKNKSVYSTLKNIMSGRKTDIIFQLKGLSSLLTHICIEIDHGNDEYKEVLFEVYGKIQELMKILK
jgi:ArsR family metal-binding transcriptional regulator